MDSNTPSGLDCKTPKAENNNNNNFGNGDNNINSNFRSNLKSGHSMPVSSLLVTPRDKLSISHLSTLSASAISHLSSSSSLPTPSSVPHYEEIDLKNSSKYSLNNNIIIKEENHDNTNLSSSTGSLISQFEQITDTSTSIDNIKLEASRADNNGVQEKPLGVLINFRITAFFFLPTKNVQN